MTFNKKLTLRLDQQITLWLQKQDKQHQTEHTSELRPVVMEVVLDSKKLETRALCIQSVSQ